MSDEVRVRQHARRRRQDAEEFVRAMPSQTTLNLALKNLEKAQEDKPKDEKPPRRAFAIPSVPAKPRKKEIVGAAKATVRTAKDVIKQRRKELKREKAQCKVEIQDAQADIGEAKVALSKAKEALKQAKEG